jgi:uncharacterized protein YbjQ (UPF0145 family)
MELGVLSQAMYHARHFALDRLVAEADALGADGIVGVQLTMGHYAWMEHMREFMAVGTAVRAHSGESFRTPQGRPFTSDLSGQDFGLALALGYRPLGLVMGNAVWHVAYQTWRQQFRQSSLNMEMPNFTQALYDARELAKERMAAEAIELGADGVVGVAMKEGSHGWEAHVIEALTHGTAVTARPGQRPELPVVLPVSG